MMKLCRFCLALSALLTFTFVSFSQGFSGLEFYPEGSSQDQEQMIMQLRKESPELAKLEERVLAINSEIQKVLSDYMAGKLTKTVAKQKLRPLLKESMEITTSTEYLVEQQLSMFLSTPPTQ
jgi:hypothetical protein